MTTALWLSRYGQKTKRVCLQESAVLSSHLRAICCSRRLPAFLAASGKGTIWVHGWQRGWVVMTTAVCCFLHMAAPEPATAESPYLTPIAKHISLFIPSTRSIELGFIFSITSIRTSVRKLSGLMCVGGSLWRRPEGCGGPSSQQGRSGVSWVASTLGIRHLHEDRLRLICDTSTKAAFLHPDLLWERWKASATGLPGIFSTLFVSSSCRYTKLSQTLQSFSASGQMLNHSRVNQQEDHLQQGTSLSPGKKL